ncbi:DUF4393 domain-containing protein [Companilactobacillus formosensis]|uniref:DUF4393 domain-containing protein n=1 Tax=Companilactobacillus formosensis TaxID=1617889 RepID=UPI000E64BAC0|nr:DUF4393 domain-containing protein [Companilactobacillus formosensis]
MNYDGFDPKDLEPFKDLINDLGHPSATAIGKALGGLFSGVLYYPTKLGIYTQYKLDEYQKKIATKLNEIPDENKDSSKLGLVMKEIEDSKYQLNSETLQEMFSELIKSTLDSKSNQCVSPRYSSILSQLNPDDAKFLKSMSESTMNNFPAVQFIFRSSNNPDIQQQSNIFVSPNYEPFELIHNDSALNVLSSLGIIEIIFDRKLSMQKGINFYKNVVLSNEYKSSANAINNMTSASSSEGFIQFTAFGISFINLVCKANH